MGDRPRNPRGLFRPKHPELPEQCASCPFREGNGRLWRALLQKLADATGAPPVTLRGAISARALIQAEAAEQGGVPLSRHGVPPRYEPAPSQ